MPMNHMAAEGFMQFFSMGFLCLSSFNERNGQSTMLKGNCKESSLCSLVCTFDQEIQSYYFYKKKKKRMAVGFGFGDLEAVEIRNGGDEEIDVP